MTYLRSLTALKIHWYYNGPERQFGIENGQNFILQQCVLLDKCNQVAVVANAKIKPSSSFASEVTIMMSSFLSYL